MITNETELHCRTVNYIRTYHKSVILAPGLGEIQDCQSKRIQAWRKGYQRGQPDVMLMNISGSYSGLAIEFKSPQGAGIVSDDQQLWIEKLRSRGWRAIVSNDYTEIVHTISEYFAHEKWICSECNHWTKGFISIANPQSIQSLIVNVVQNMYQMITSRLARHQLIL